MAHLTTDFISQISIKSANQDIWSLEDIANVAALCFHQAVAKSTNSRVDWSEPRQPRLSMDVFTNLFGWKSKTYSSQGAKQEIKAFVTVVEAAAAAVVSDSDVQHQECGICFKDMRDKGEDTTIYRQIFVDIIVYILLYLHKNVIEKAAC